MSQARTRRRLHGLSTSVLRAYDASLDVLPDFVLTEHRVAVKEELLARELPSIADESGGHPVAPVRGQQ